jgi:hypothetical protein
MYAYFPHMKSTILLSIFLTQNAHALTTPQYGPYFDAGGTVAAPLHNAAWSSGATLSAGFWLGNYDSVYAIGKYTSLGITTNLSYNRQVESLLEIRKGLDMLVVNVFAVGGGGFKYIAPDFVPTAHLGLGFKRRRTPHFGWSLRLEGVTTFIESPSTHLQISLAGSFARPSGDQKP